MCLSGWQRLLYSLRMCVWLHKCVWCILYFCALSVPAGLTNGLEMQHSHSVATQTCEIPDASEQPPLLLPAQRSASLFLVYFETKLNFVP